MVNPILLDILIRKIKSGEVKIEDIKLQEYKDAVQAALNS